MRKRKGREELKTSEGREDEEIYNNEKEQVEKGSENEEEAMT